MTTCTCSMPIPLRAAKGEVYAWRCSQCGLPLPAPDPRDAEIAALKAQIDEDNRVILAVREHNRQLRAALAAGPAALRIDARDGLPWGPYKQLPVEEAVATVEAAQADAMNNTKETKS